MALSDVVKISEKDIENLVLTWLDYKGFYPIKIDNVGIFDPKKKVFRQKKSPYKRSPPDIIFFYKGETIFCEIKTPEKLAYITRNWKNLVAKVSPSQAHLHKQVDCCINVTQRGVRFIFVDSLDYLKHELRMIDEGKRQKEDSLGWY